MLLLLLLLLPAINQLCLRHLSLLLHLATILQMLNASQEYKVLLFPGEAERTSIQEHKARLAPM